MRTPFSIRKTKTRVLVLVQPFVVTFGKSLPLSGPQFSTHTLVGIGILSEMLSAILSCSMLWQQKNSNSSLVLPLTGSCFPLAWFQEQALLSSALLPLTPLFVLLPKIKPRAPLLSRLLGFGPASQVAAGTQMKGPSEGCLWLSAQPSSTEAWQPWAQLSHKTSWNHSHTRLPLWVLLQGRPVPTHKDPLSFPLLLARLRNTQVLREWSRAGAEWPDLGSTFWRALFHLLFRTTLVADSAILL